MISVTLRDTARRFYAPPESLALPIFRFPPDEERHIFQVLRLVPGTEVIAVDGAGNAARVVLEEGGRGCARVIERLAPERVAPFHLTVASALLRGRSLDDVVERCTELGALAFQPFVSERTVVAPTAGASLKRRGRYGRLALSAMKVAGSALCPEILPVATWGDLLLRIPRFDAALICDGSAPRPLRPVARAERVLLVIGPEGGWAAGELEAAVESGAVAVNLGARNLRAATAAAAATAIVLSGGREEDLKGLR